jgi:diaminopimelate epimerase
MRIKFAKLQALGNDYIFVDLFREKLSGLDWGMISQKICQRNFGVGSDGLILIVPGKKEKFKMMVFNPDGSEAEMCGNAVRCVTRHIYESGLSKNREQRIETKGRMIETQILKDDQNNFLVKADMGKPVLERKKIPAKGAGKFFIQERLKIGKRNCEITCVNMGNPHAILIVRKFPKDWQKIGSLIENHPIFPERINVEFVEILNRKKISLLVWERGAGPTLASATGASAALVASVLKGKTDREVEVLFPSGKLKVFWDDKNHNILVIGPAVRVFSGIYNF